MIACWEDIFKSCITLVLSFRRKKAQNCKRWLAGFPRAYGTWIKQPSYTYMRFRLTWPEPGLINMIFIGNERKLKRLLFSAWSALVHDLRNARGTVVHNNRNDSVVHEAIGRKLCSAHTFLLQLICGRLLSKNDWFSRKNIFAAIGKYVFIFITRNSKRRYHAGESMLW